MAAFTPRIPPSNDSNPQTKVPQPTQNAPLSPTAPPYSPITPSISNSLIPPAEPPREAGAMSQQPSSPSRTQQMPQPSHFGMTSATPQRGSMPAPPVPANEASQPRPPSPQEPPPEPLDLNTNTDAMALKAAMSVLALQRQQAVRDMQSLEQQKQVALADPKAYADAVKDGRVKMRDPTGGVLAFNYSDDEESVDEEGADEDGGRGDEDAMDVDLKNAGLQKYALLPQAQNVVRTPPINWNKYHIVGPALDHLHEEQVRNPSEGRPRTDEDVRLMRERHIKLKQKEDLKKMALQGKVPGRKGPSTVAAPYDVFKDSILGKGAVAAALKEGEGGKIDDKKKPTKKKGPSVAATTSPRVASSNKKKGTAAKGAAGNTNKKKGGRGRPNMTSVISNTASTTTSGSPQASVPTPTSASPAGVDGSAAVTSTSAIQAPVGPGTRPS